MAGEEKGRVLKVMLFGEEGEPAGEWSSHQMPVDEFKYSHGLQEPPYPPEQLVFLAESHPTHGAALEQKSADIVGGGWEWRPTEDGASEDVRDELDAWWSSLGDDPEEDSTLKEALDNFVLDVQTVGWGTLEVARDAAGVVRRVYHMPAHTVRFARDGIRVAQMRGGKRVWFKRWMPGDERYVDRITGAIRDGGGEDPPAAQVARRSNEVLVVKKMSRRSSWYGIPTYVTATGWVVLSLAARDDNILFFHNRREPRWAVILTNLEDDPEVEEALRQAFQVDLKQPHRNLLVPITGGGEIEFKALGDNKGDMSFERLQTRADASILLAHRMPPERIGLSKVGPLGGNVVIAATKVYKEGVIGPEQESLAARVNRFIAAEFDPKREKPLGWTWRPRELDLTEEREDTELAVTAFESDLITVNEGRRRLKEQELDDGRGDMFHSEIVGTPAARAGFAEVDRRKARDLSARIADTLAALKQSREG